MFCRVLFLENFAHDATFAFRPAAVPDATISPHTRASDVQNNEAVQNTVPEVGTGTKSPAKSLPTPAPAQRRKTILNLSLPMIQ